MALILFVLLVLHSVQDVVEILTKSSDVKQYIKRMLSQNEQIKNYWGTICTLIEMEAADGKKPKVQAVRVIVRFLQNKPFSRS